MQHGELNWIANYIWGIADDVLRDLYVRGKYRDVILPMTVLRRLDAVLEDSKAGRSGAAGPARQKAALRASCAARCYPTRPMIGTIRRASRSATRSASRATFTSRSRCGRWMRFGRDILAVERETEGLLAEIIGDGGK